LIDEMTAKHKAHIKLLERLQMKSSLKDFSVSTQDKFARDVDKIWTSATRKFKKGIPLRVYAGQLVMHTHTCSFDGADERSEE
jgi:hypothetical protein